MKIEPDEWENGKLLLMDMIGERIKEIGEKKRSFDALIARLKVQSVVWRKIGADVQSLESTLHQAEMERAQIMGEVDVLDRAITQLETIKRPEPARFPFTK